MGNTSYCNILRKKWEYHLQVPAEQRIITTVEDFPQGGAKTPLITLQSEVIRDLQHLRGHPGDPVQDH